MVDPPRICVVGSANVDLTFRTPRLPRPGETLAGHAFHLGMGGKGANQAVAAARLGASVSLLARVGNDAFGQEAINRYRTEGIDVAAIVVAQDRPTGTAAIVVDDNAENTIIVVPGANGGLTSEDVRTASPAIENAQVLLCQLETPIAATLTAFHIARGAGVRTILTPAPAVELSDELLQLCDLCIPNHVELELLTGRRIDGIGDTESAARELLRRGIGTVVVTQGSRGAFVVGPNGSTHIPALAVNAVDSTGAGDAFTAALAVRWGAGQSLVDAAQWATVIAAVTVSRLGAQTAFPTLAEVDRWRVAGIKR